MTLKKPLIFALSLLFTLLSFGQIKISEHVQESEYAKQTENALYFVDYWATWCIPCTHVKKYLSTLQQQFSNDFYILSLSEESPEKVNRYLQRNPTGLAIALDYEGENFRKNSITSLPYGILYNAKGEKLWEGHPADFKANDVTRFLKQHKKKIAVTNLFKAKKYKTYTSKKPYSPKKDFEISEVKNEDASFQVIYKEEFVELKGSLKDILAYSNNVYKNQFEISSKLNKQYKVYFKCNTDAYNTMSEHILNALKLKQSKSSVNGEALVFNIKKPAFWDTNQINWGIGGEKYLIGDSEIKADNVTLNEVSYTLAKLLETPIVISNKKVDTKVHDWQIHYKYFELMASNLSDYGIQIERKQVDYPQYIITKKTP